MGLGQDEAHPEIASQLTAYHLCDLTNEAQVAALDLGGITAVINLAGLAQQGASFAAADLYKKVNVEVVTSLGKHLLADGSKARLIAVSTGAVYDSSQPLPLTETSKTTHASPYAESKLMMETTVNDLRAQGLDAVTVRPFNHIGPGQAPGFLLPDLYKKLQAIDQTSGHIQVGNLATKRDYTDVRDIVKAYVSLATASSLKHELYNVCSGTSRDGKEVLEALLTATHLQDRVVVDVDQSLVRPTDPPDLYGNAERLRQETGWSPAIAFDQTIRDFVDWART